MPAAAYHRIVASMDKRSPEYVPIRGDAGSHNVLITPAGERWRNTLRYSALRAARTCGID
jgi:hypothetical protein